jgi:hypothetical protein
MYCDHGKEICHTCCVDYSVGNRVILHGPPDEIEGLCEQKIALQKGITFMEQQTDPAAIASMAENLQYQRKMLKKTEKKLKSLHDTGKDVASVWASISAREAVHDNRFWRDVGGLAASPFATTNAAIYAGDAVNTALPNLNKCGYCSVVQEGRLMKCARCKKVVYCDRNCQKAAWKEHKITCGISA